MNDYNSLFDDLIKKVEGHKEDVYTDSRGVPTIGTGLNLKDDTVRGLMQLRNYDPDEVIGGKRKVDPNDLQEIQKAYVQKREPMVRERLGNDLFETLAPNEKAAIMSMGYQSLNNIGPNLQNYIASGDKIGAVREMILNTNKHKSPGIFSRRLQEAEMFSPQDFQDSFQTLTPEEKQFVRSMIEGVDNEHTKKELMAKFGEYIQERKPAFATMRKRILDDY